MHDGTLMFLLLKEYVFRHLEDFWLRIEMNTSRKQLIFPMISLKCCGHSQLIFEPALIIVFICSEESTLGMKLESADLYEGKFS